MVATIAQKFNMMTADDRASIAKLFGIRVGQRGIDGARILEHLTNMNINSVRTLIARGTRTMVPLAIRTALPSGSSAMASGRSGSAEVPEP